MSVRSGEERGLIFLTAAGNRAKVGALCMIIIVYRDIEPTKQPAQLKVKYPTNKLLQSTLLLISTSVMRECLNERFHRMSNFLSLVISATTQKIFKRLFNF